MKIKSFSTEQYAGIRDLSVEFSDGLNVVLGNNESGKSTMIYALYSALNQPTKLGAKSKSDKDYTKSAFPTDGRQTVDAAVCVKTPDDEYRIEKIWDISAKQEEAKFSLKGKNSGVLRGAQAEERLRELCGFGASVYTNVVFGRQSNEGAMLDWCGRFFSAVSYDDIDEVKQKISEGLSAVGGISQDKFRELLESRIADMEKNWDFSRNRAGNNKRNGILAQAYCELKQAEDERDSVLDAAQRIEGGTKRILEIREQLSELSRSESELNAKREEISARSNLAALIASVEKELSAAASSADGFPRAVRFQKTAEALREAKQESEKRGEKARIMQLLEEAEKISAEIKRLSDKTAQYPAIKEDSRRARELSGAISRAEAALSAAKLVADIQLCEGVSACVSFADGSKTVSGSERVEADGFVGVDIPGVAAIRVSPQELDVDGLISQREKASEELSQLLAQYNAADADALAALADENAAALRELELSKRGLSQLLGGKTAAELQEEAESISVDESVEVPETLEKDIAALLKESGARSLDALIGSAEKTISDFTAAYTDEKTVKAKISDLKAKRAEYSAQLERFSDAEVISEAEFSEKLSEIEKTRGKLEREADELNRMIGSFEERADRDISELDMTIKQRREKLESEKEKYAAYKRIQKDFEEIASETESGFDGFYDKFGEYLRIISGGKVSFESGGDELKLKSGGNAIDGELLSEGTKKTVLLAFRLAVLDFFYPDGGGFVVLDDDLVDMDPDRRAHAAELLGQFAQRNQVIITTCDPNVAKLLGGNLISLT